MQQGINEIYICLRDWYKVTEMTPTRREEEISFFTALGYNKHCIAEGFRKFEKEFFRAKNTKN